MERYIAIDNVCAWPNLTLMPNGDIVTTIFNQPCHGKWEGDAECWVSSDGGCFWSRRGVPAPHEPETIRMNVAAGLARNGDLVVLCSGWGGENFRGCILPCWVCRSADAGVTWERGEDVPFEGERPFVPFGDVVQLDEETLGVTCYAREVGTQFMCSGDDGRTWGEASLIADETNETDLLVLDNGHMLAAARTYQDAHLDLYRSEDQGSTWKHECQVTGPNMHPAHLTKLSNGYILLSYGIRHRGFYGVGVRYSDDDGKTWYTPAALCTVDDAFDGGYPSSVQLDDGTIVTAFYASGVGEHQRYHMGVMRWKFEEPFGSATPDGAESARAERRDRRR